MTNVFLAGNQGVLSDCMRGKTGVHVMGTAANGRVAETMLASSVPDVLLVDLIMPEMDGLTLIERVKKAPAHRDTRVILLSSFMTELVYDKARRLGADACIGKPYNPEKICALVRELGESRETRQ